MCWFQLPKWKDLLLFFVLWDSKRRGFGFWTVSRTKGLHVKTSLWAIQSCDEHLPHTLKKDKSGVLMWGCVRHLSLVSASPAVGDRQLSPPCEEKAAPAGSKAEHRTAPNHKCFEHFLMLYVAIKQAFPLAHFLHRITSVFLHTSAMQCRRKRAV